MRFASIINGPLMRYAALCVALIGIGTAVVLNRPNLRHQNVQNRNKSGHPIRITISGTVMRHETPENGPGCVLVLSNGKDTGLYLVHEAYTDAIARYPAGSRAVLQIWQHARTENGIYETI